MVVEICVLRFVESCVVSTVGTFVVGGVEC